MCKGEDWPRLVVLHYVERLKLAPIGRQRCHRVSEWENYSLRDLQEVPTLHSQLYLVDHGVRSCARIPASPYSFLCILFRCPCTPSSDRGESWSASRNVRAISILNNISRCLTCNVCADRWDLITRIGPINPHRPIIANSLSDYFYFKIAAWLVDSVYISFDLM
jgi:hypothetical protein